MGRPAKQADCHVKRKHYAKGMCERCYKDAKNARASSTGTTYGPALLRGIPAGWGSLREAEWWINE